MTDARTTTWIGAALGLTLGLALGGVIGATLGLRHEPAPLAGPTATDVQPATPLAAPAAPELVRLRELETEAAWWREAYEELARSLEHPEAPVASGAAPAESDAEAASAPVADPPAPAAGFDAATLLARGYTEAEILRVRERLEALDLELLYLGDRARREGWHERPRFQAEVRRLREALRADLGEREFDAALYVSGRYNRVDVAGVLADSAAERAGLRPGDELISYDGRRIFDARAIVRATAEGEAGGTTELRVRRGEEELRFLLPRGPIGIRLQPVRRPPDGSL